MWKNLFLLFLLFGIAVFSVMSTNSKADRKFIAINQFVNHPALDNAMHGVEASLKERRLNLKVGVQNAQGNIASAAQIAKHQASDNPDVIVAIATPSAQASLKARNPEKTLLAFVAVTDPVAAGLTKAENVIGVVDSPPIDKLINILLKVLPKRKKIGIVFNPGEINSVKMIENFDRIAKTKGLKVITSPVNSTSNIKLAVQKLIGKVDIIFLPQDNLVVSAIDSLTQITLNNKIPVIGNDPSLVDNGLLFALGCDYFKSGEQLGQMIADTLEGKKIEPKIQTTNIMEYKINEKIANILGIDLKLLKEANNE